METQLERSPLRNGWQAGPDIRIEGALDNGCNAAMVVALARLFRAADLHPRRTLCASYLFSGEEQGVPNLVTHQDWTDYLPNHNAESDTFDKVDSKVPRDQTAQAAMLLWGLADAPRIPKRQNPAAGGV